MNNIKNKTKGIRKCIDCGGTGYEIITRGDYLPHTCNSCNGSGKISKSSHTYPVLGQEEDVVIIKDEYCAFEEWYEKNKLRFHHGQFDEKQIAYSAFCEGINFWNKVTK